jgi:REP element-mobilizing transposase RayT
LVHLVFSTKNRIPFLQSEQLRSEVHAYLTATLQGQDCQAIQVGGVADHAHLLFGLSRTISLADLVKHLKTSSTKMMREKGHAGFSWQTGYGAFSVSESNKSAVIAYIVDQEIHHRKMTFQEEIRALLTRHSIRFDERYVWD